MNTLKDTRSSFWKQKSSSVIIVAILFTVFAAFPNTLTYIQQYWQTSGHICQSLWNKFLLYFGEDEFTLVVHGTTLATFLLYWGVGIIYTLLDVTNWPKFLRKYKVQPGTNEPISSKELMKIFTQALINQIFVGVPFRIVSYYILTWRGLPNLHILPTFHRFLFDLIICVIMGEIGFYYFHRTLHDNRIYKYVHKQHHELTAPVAISTAYCHPLEHLLANMIPPFLGPMIMGSHIATQLLWFTLTQFGNVVVHSGYHFPGLPSPEFHDFHHAKFNVNYGTIGVLDYLHGTDAQFRVNPAYKRHTVSFSLTPVRELFPEKNYKTM